MSLQTFLSQYFVWRTAHLDPKLSAGVTRRCAGEASLQRLLGPPWTFEEGAQLGGAGVPRDGG